MSALQKTHLTVGIVILVSMGAYGYLHVWYPLIFPTLMGFGLVRAGLTGNCPMTRLWERIGKKSNEATPLSQ